jgi:hypothetical protein
MMGQDVGLRGGERRTDTEGVRGRERIAKMLTGRRQSMPRREGKKQRTFAREGLLREATTAREKRGGVDDGLSSEQAMESEACGERPAM